MMKMELDGLKILGEDNENQTISITLSEDRDTWKYLLYLTVFKKKARSFAMMNPLNGIS
jgi:hypothetical protein